jgi:glycosyltransferase involved in cell wall biosynthesis
LSDHDLRPDDSVRYTIASWFWELSCVPHPFNAELSRPDELWVASRFVREALRSAAPPRTPIIVVPCLVDVPMPPRAERSDFGLPDDATLFFFNFDARSSPARKNPWGVIEAFRRAFNPDERRSSARLVMKVHNLDYAPDFKAALRDALTAVDGILIDAELTREAMNGLLASIDVYVSLHRSEGLGLGIAEAMFLGKPVVVTAYSGNMDFTDAANSCLVGYELREIEEADHIYLASSATVYQPGLHWAEPSIPQAADWLRRLYDHPEWRRRIGSAGAATIRSRYSRAAVQRVLVRRLHEIERSLGEIK